jgi:nucleotide-binding universal stress UspA family protein
MTAFTRILCPVDFTEVSRRTLRYAAATAKWFGAKLVVLHVWPLGQPANVIPSLVTAEALARLTRQEVPGDVDVEVRFEHERDVAAEITRDAAGFRSDLIVIGDHGRTGIDRLLSASVSESVLRAAPCAVLVVPHHALHPLAPGDVAFDRLLCAVDFSAPSIEGLSTSLTLAEDADARLTLLNVVDAPGHLDEVSPVNQAERLALDAADRATRLQRLREFVPPSARTYCHVETDVTEGKPAAEILLAARERASDLIVMGAGGRGALASLVLGSTTHDVLRQAPCPVLVIHAR